MLAENSLAEKTLVATVMSNAGLEAAIKDAGGKMLRTPVGDKNVIDEMLRERFQLRRRAERPFDFPRLRHDRRRPGGGAANFADSKNETNAALETGAMLEPVPAARDQREGAREKTDRAARRGEPNSSPTRKKNCPRKAGGCCCAIPARNRKCACSWKAATRNHWRHGPKKSAARSRNRLARKRSAGQFICRWRGWPGSTRR